MQTETDRRENILSALNAFIRQRPGLEWANYGDASSYRSESRSITRDLNQAQALLRAVRYADISADQLMQAARGAYSGRLSIIERDGKAIIDYCTGQYFPTEYRRAACAVLASALWDYWRESAPAPNAYRVREWGGEWKSAPFSDRAEARALLDGMGGDNFGHVQELRNGLAMADYIRAVAHAYLGRAIADRWFK